MTENNKSSSYTSFLTYRKIFIGICLLILFFVISIFITDSFVSSFAEQYCFNSANEIPSHKVAIILGTSRTLSNGKLNSYYRLRIEAAYLLYKANKVQYFLISGDNSSKDYDEPSMIRKDLIEKGIPESIIYRDYAGFRTLDSIVRATQIFNLKNFIVISQKFHNERAVFLARKKGLNAIGFNAKMPDNGKQRFIAKIREKFAPGFSPT